ncbi:hypothetical protein DC998_002323 [Escherichia coli]|nr:hypothetical protein [Escherichia coli]EFO0178254.1 hypothetical protein [Escherichia coli]EFO0891366.1 hypothetical protein [Escherichia coli]EFO1034120.1 hypothetical protein [Escherichia coli]EGM5970666.1 hypothetical protein [Escherichia coli]
MKQMSLIEMDGFLKGKCIPRDLKVNETNAEYLVRKFAEAEAKCAALAAENAGLKAAHPQPFGPEMMKALDAYEKHQDEVPETGMLDAFFILRDSIRVETPATDAFLAEVRAQGVDAAIEAAKNLVAKEYECKDFKAAQSDCCMHPGSDLVGKVEMTEWLVDFAAQLRKGGNQ